jgi:hypothetical protein
MQQSTQRNQRRSKEHTIGTIFDRSAPVSGDSSRLQQVFWNLLSNAVKFSPKGSEITVELRYASSAEVTVKDQGRGIEADFLPHVFDRFRQADSSTTRRYGGLGLGLAIVRHLVELHGGRVKAESEGKDQGAAFTVFLPLLSGTPVVDRDVDALAGRTIERAAGQQVLQNRALVVDDESDARVIAASVVGIWRRGRSLTRRCPQFGCWKSGSLKCCCQTFRCRRSTAIHSSGKLENTIMGEWRQLR